MAKDPAFLFYPNDYLGGTMGMTFEEKGAYMELLMMQFNRGHMTSHMIGHVLGQEGGQIWDKIKHKFIQDENGLWYNERLDEEKNKRKAYTESRKNNIKGVNQYTSKKKKNGGHMTSHMENENINENIDINNIKGEIKKFCSKNSEEVFMAFEKWRDYMAKQHDKVLAENKYTYQILFDAVRNIGADGIIEAIDHSILGTYKKIYSPKEQHNGTSKGINGASQTAKAKYSRNTPSGDYSSDWDD